MKSERLRHLLYIITAAVSLAACSRPLYTCESKLPQSMQCTLNGDTVYYVTNGFSDVNERVKSYYESMGFTCVEVNTLVGGIKVYEGIDDKKDVKFLEEQGFVCYEEIH